MTAPRRWTQDNRYIVWTMGDNADLYNLYIGGNLLLENATFDEFYPVYRSYADGMHKNKAA